MTTSSAITDALLAQRGVFKAFLVSRLGNASDAEDVLQSSLLKAWQHGGELRDEARVSAWFYGILRHAVVDHLRQRNAAAAREQSWSTDPALALTSDAAAAKALCRCFEPLLATLKPRHAELLRRVEFEDQPVAAVAAALGLSTNAASVTLHRARGELRERLEAFCGACASGACLDCDCPPSSRVATSRRVSRVT
ncbi:sigma-70 family RNA polymerase sigma factor [Opitutus terrae]|uniref:RNA polymerase sigma factor n=1 Tax=Opitutus terrae (strain DSM 11246 / JCM 15787 / PB90-1) TaxID=452637 RepID=B1ZVS9_OPITP|nr:sigma-70 family RNA polymerase sigma factor [Opitutus terrae]ACB75015.1 RNA polymerase, sigma-24 subunit, ECF subfamily [Opitutus terrae PB90-1]